MNAPAYPKTKKSGVEWLGDIPEHWEVRRLKFAAPLINDKVNASDSGLPYMGLEHIESWTGRRIPDADAASDGIATRFMPGDVLFGKLRPYLAKVYLADCEGVASTELLVLRSEKGICPEFLRYYAVSRDFINAVDASTYGAKMPRANWEFIGNQPFLLPRLAEQQAIAEFLDRKTGRIDELIGKKKELIAKLNEQRSALITSAVTGKIPEIGSRRTEDGGRKTEDGRRETEVGGRKSAVRMKDSGVEWLGQIPEHWEVRRLKFLTKVIGGGTPSTGNSKYWNGDIPWVSPKDMKSDLIDSAQDNITELGAAESATKIVQPNTVLVVVRSGILRHTIPIARNTVQVALNQDMKGFTPENGLTPEYLHLLIAGNQKQLLPLWSKPGCTVESLEVELMMNTEISVPSAMEQQAIAEYLDEKTGKIDGLIRKTETAIQTLEEYRTALITAAVTGKIDVGDKGKTRTGMDARGQ